MISNAAKFLETMFTELNNKFFNGEVQTPVITIQSTPRAYGHCSVNPVWQEETDKKYELNLGAENLNRKIEEVAATMIHEMTHLLNIQHGVKDCSRGNIYHNKKFKEEGEKHGIQIEHHELYGWTITTPSKELCEFCKEKGWNKVGMNRGELIEESNTATPTKTPTEKKKSSSIKYVCPCCGLIIRATKIVHVICAECAIEFEAKE